MTNLSAKARNKKSDKGDSYPKEDNYPITGGDKKKAIERKGNAGALTKVGKFKEKLKGNTPTGQEGNSKSFKKITKDPKNKLESKNKSRHKAGNGY